MQHRLELLHQSDFFAVRSLSLNMKESLKIAGAIILPNLASIVNSKITRDNIPNFYDKLKHPSYKPPNWLFAPVWTSLYSGMGYAAYLVWKEGGGFTGDARLPLAMYGTQLALNWAWSPIFFGQKNIKMALFDLVAVTATASACTAMFFQIDKTAGYLMLPYLAWLGYATLLNYSVYKLNPNPAIEPPPPKSK